MSDMAVFNNGLEEKNGVLMMSSNNIATMCGKGHDKVIDLIRKRFPDIQIIELKTNNAKKAYLTVEQVTELIRTMRNLREDVRKWLEEMPSFLPVSGSMEGLFGDALEFALIGFGAAKNLEHTLLRQIKRDKYIFDFYIPAADLYIEYNEKGSHHNYTKDKEKINSVNQEVMVVDYKSSIKENVTRVIEKIQRKRPPKNTPLEIIEVFISFKEEIVGGFGLKQDTYEGEITRGITLHYGSINGFSMHAYGRFYPSRKNKKNPKFTVDGVVYRVIEYEFKDGGIIVRYIRK